MAKEEGWLAAVVETRSGLTEWHEAVLVLVEDYATLPGEEKEAVEAWRRRAYGRTPIDERKPRFCQTSSDLEKFVAV